MATMHYADLNTSARLQKLYKLLRQGIELTTAQIQRVTGSMAVGTDISELRKNGFDITCRYICRMPSGAKKYGYRMA